MAISWDSVGQVVKQSAPLIGGLLGAAAGPAGAKIGAQVGGLVASALGTDATPDAVLAAIETDPETLVKVRELELRDNESLRSLQYKLAELEIEEYRIEVADRDSARGAHRDHWMPAALTLVLAVMITGVVSALIFVDTTPDGSKEILFVLVGNIATAFSGAIAYWLGGARGYGARTDTTRLLKKAKP